MKQKILIRVTMTDDKTRAKAMKKAVQFKGVTGVEIKGDHKNQIEVTGEEIDMITLTEKLRKKVAFAELVSVTKVEPPKKDVKEGDKKGGDGNKKGLCDKNLPMPCYPWPDHGHGYGVPSSFPYPCHPHNHIGEPVYNHQSNCPIM